MKPSVKLSRFAFSTSLLVAVGFLLATTAQAQSGRRAPKRVATVPTVSGPKTVEKKPEPPKDSRVPLVVAIDDNNLFTNIPFFLADTIKDTCADRLRKSSAVTVDIAARGMSRSEAIKRAKSEKETYVVWLQIDTDSDRNATSSTAWAPESLYLRFIVFTPGTAKIKASGRTRTVYRSGRGGVIERIPSRGGPMYSDWALKQAAHEAAEAILNAFTVRIPDMSLPG